MPILLVKWQEYHRVVSTSQKLSKLSLGKVQNYKPKRSERLIKGIPHHEPAGIRAGRTGRAIQ
jgi:hypothetical protein